MQDPPCVCRLMLFCERENLYSLLLFSLKVSNGFTEFCSHEEITVFSITSSLSVPNECWILSISLKKFWIGFLQFSAVTIMNTVYFHRASSKGAWTQACSPYSGKIGVELWLKPVFLMCSTKSTHFRYHLSVYIKLLLNRSVWNLVKPSFLLLFFLNVYLLFAEVFLFVVSQWLHCHKNMNL